MAEMFISSIGLTPYCLQNSTGEPWNVLVSNGDVNLPLHSPAMACGRLLLPQGGSANALQLLV